MIRFQFSADTIIVATNMKHRKLEDNIKGHVVLVYDKNRLVLREVYETYGKAMWRILDLEKLYPKNTIEYRDTRSFRTDSYE